MPERPKSKAQLAEEEARRPKTEEELAIERAESTVDEWQEELESLMKAPVSAPKPKPIEIQVEQQPAVLRILPPVLFLASVITFFLNEQGVFDSLFQDFDLD